MTSFWAVSYTKLSYVFEYGVHVMNYFNSSFFVEQGFGAQMRSGTVQNTQCGYTFRK